MLFFQWYPRSWNTFLRKYLHLFSSIFLRCGWEDKGYGDISDFRLFLQYASIEMIQSTFNLRVDICPLHVYLISNREISEVFSYFNWPYMLNLELEFLIQNQRTRRWTVDPIGPLNNRVSNV